MREIVILSGKGGTGKTSLCAAFAQLADKTLLCDLDVDAPDLHIIAQPNILQKHDFFAGNEAHIDAEKCVRCGRCADACQFSAIELADNVYSVKPWTCEGCGLCPTLCPAKAIAFPERHCGEWYVSESRFGPMIHAQLFPAQENSGRLVSLLKSEARKMVRERALELMLCDGSPGIGCPVISSLAGATLAVLVSEPTPSGLHDLERIGGLCEHFRVPAAVIINKADISPNGSQAIRDFCSAQGHTLLGELPFDPEFMQSMRARQALTERPGPLAMQIKKIWGRILALEPEPLLRAL